MLVEKAHHFVRFFVYSPPPKRQKFFFFSLFHFCAEIRFLAQFTSLIYFDFFPQVDSGTTMSEKPMPVAENSKELGTLEPPNVSFNTLLEELSMFLILSW